MPHPFLPQLPFEDSVTGGPLRITFPTEPAAPAPTTPVPAAPLPLPAFPMPDIDGDGMISDEEFQFAEAVLGNPATPQEALELLGIFSGPTSGGGISFGGDRTVFSVDGVGVVVDSFPAVLGGAAGQAAREKFLEDLLRILDESDGNRELTVGSPSEMLD